MAALSYPVDTPTYIDGECYSAQQDRRVFGSMVCSEGVEAFTELRVTENAPTGMSVLVSEGGAWIGNDEGTDEGPYHFFNPDPIVVAIDLNTSGATRTDRIWARICDAQYSAEGTGGSVYYEPGGDATPPDDGCTYYLLATISVPNGAVNITGTPDAFGSTEGNITDERQQYVLCTSPGSEYYRANVTSATATGVGTSALPGTGITIPARPYARKIKLRGYHMAQAWAAGTYYNITIRKGGVEFAPRSQARENAANNSISIEQDDTLAAGATATYQLYQEGVGAGALVTAAFTGDGRNFVYLIAEVTPV